MFVTGVVKILINDANLKPEKIIKVSRCHLLYYQKNGFEYWYLRKCLRKLAASFKKF